MLLVFYSYYFFNWNDMDFVDFSTMIPCRIMNPPEPVQRPPEPPLPHSVLGQSVQSLQGPGPEQALEG